MLTQLRNGSLRILGVGLFDVSENGVLIYQAGDSLEKRITWFDRAGKELSAGERGSYVELETLAGWSKARIQAGDTDNDIWVDELARGVHIRLTNDPGLLRQSDLVAGRKPDSVRRGTSRRGIYQMNSNGAGGKELLLPAETSEGGWPTSWSPDGRFILYVRGTPLNPIQDVWVLPLVGDRKPRLFVQNAFDGQFSPDGRWVAYTSMESGKPQIYVVPFDATKVLNTEPGAVTSLTRQIPDFGQWRRNRPVARGRQGNLLFWAGATQMMAAEVDGRGDSFEARKEQALFKLPEGFGLYDVAPDGKRFVTSRGVANPNTPLTLVQNWTALLGKP